jgi:hypothetical protein
MPESTYQPQAVPSWRILMERARLRIWPPETPDHAPAPGLTAEEDFRRRLDRIRDLLEQTRASLVRNGWTAGGWFSVDAAGSASRAGGTATGSVGARLVGTQEAYGLLAPGETVRAACLVGAMLRLVEDPDTAPSVADAWGCVDELHEAVHERMGHVSFPPGRIYAHEQRRAHLTVLTAWNDEPGRRLEDVLDVIDRAVSRTMVGACMTP